jgi:hypothetical protein
MDGQIEVKEKSCVLIVDEIEISNNRKNFYGAGLGQNSTAALWIRV